MILEKDNILLKPTHFLSLFSLQNGPNVGILLGNLKFFTWCSSIRCFFFLGLGFRLTLESEIFLYAARVLREEFYSDHQCWVEARVFCKLFSHLRV